MRRKGKWRQLMVKCYYYITTSMKSMIIVKSLSIFQQLIFVRHVQSCDSVWIFLSGQCSISSHSTNLSIKIGHTWWYELACQTHFWTVNDKEKEINAIQPCFTSFHDFAFLDCRTGTKSLVILCSDRYPIRYLLIHKHTFNMILIIDPWLPFQYLSTLYCKMSYVPLFWTWYVSKKNIF